MTYIYVRLNKSYNDYILLGFSNDLTETDKILTEYELYKGSFKEVYEFEKNKAKFVFKMLEYELKQYKNKNNMSSSLYKKEALNDIESILVSHNIDYKIIVSPI